MSRAETVCEFFPQSTCFHSSCYWRTLPPRLGARFKANAHARDWLGNWGRIVYDPRDHGRDVARRKLAAGIIRGMRRGAIDYGTACAGGAWAGALMPRARV